MFLGKYEFYFNKGLTQYFWEQLWFVPIFFSMPEQVGNAALLFDPFDIEDIVDKIYLVWKDENKRKTH
jgi:hypothetical protein